MKKKLLAVMLLFAMVASNFSGVVVPHIHAEEVVDLTTGETAQTEQQEETPAEQEPATEDGGIAVYSSAASLPREISSLAAGEYILTGDVSVATTITLSGDVVIDLSGHTMTAPEGVPCFKGNNNATLTINDTSGGGSFRPLQRWVFCEIKEDISCVSYGYMIK